MKLSKLAITSVYLALQIPLSLVLAQEERNYDASIALGYVGTSGNTETITFNTEALLTYRTINWTHNMKFQALRSSKDGAADAERYYLEEKSDYNLSTDGYLFGKATYTRDRFSGFDSQTSISTGYGRYFYQKNNLNIQGYSGLGYRENDVINSSQIGETILTLGEELEWRISETSKLVQNLTSGIGEETAVTKFNVGLESNIIGNIVTKIAFEFRNTSKVPAGIDKTDTLMSISLTYTF